MSARARRAARAPIARVRLEEKRSPTWRASAAVFAGALLVRLVYLWQISDAPFFRLRLGDAAGYHEWASRIAAGDWIGSGVFYQAPLYPYVLGLWYRVFGDGAAAVRVVHAFLSAGSCSLLAAAGMWLFGRAGVAAGWALAIFPPAIFLDGLLDKTALATLLSTALLLVAVREKWLAAGVLVGLLALTRENALILLLPVLGWIATRQERRRAGVIAVVAGCTMVLLPVAIRNRVAGGEWHLITSQSGPNLYIGNHAGASGSYEALVPGHGNVSDEREDATRLAEQAAGHKLTAGEVSRYWTGRAMHFAISQPFDWVRLMVRKFALALNATEIADTESQEVYGEWSRLLRVLRPLDFGIVLGVAVFALAASGRQWRQHLLLYGLAAAYLASVAAFYVLARYRFPLVPVLLLSGSSAIPRIGTWWRSDRRRVAAAAAVAVFAAGLTHLPVEDSRTSRATNYLAIATALAKDPAQIEAADGFYRRALDADAKFPAAQFGLGTLLMRQGRPGDAVPHFRAAVSSWSDYEEAHFNLGQALTATGRPQDALEEFRYALRLRPDDPDVHAVLGRTLLALGVAEEGIRHLVRALEINPSDGAAHNSLGAALANQGRVAEALPHFERAVELSPQHAGAHSNLEAARKMLANKK